MSDTGDYPPRLTQYEPMWLIAAVYELGDFSDLSGREVVLRTNDLLMVRSRRRRRGAGPCG